MRIEHNAKTDELLPRKANVKNLKLLVALCLTHILGFLGRKIPVTC